MVAIGKVKASTYLHHDLLSNILQSPMVFFDVTPVGRILNRFGKDTDVIDTQIPQNIVMFLGCMYRVLGTFLVVGMSTPYVVTLFVPITIFFLLMQVYPYTSNRFYECLTICCSSFDPWSEKCQCGFWF